MSSFKSAEWDAHFGENTVPVIGYETRGIFDVSVAEIRNNHYISVDVIAIERGYVKIHNDMYLHITKPNAEERKILEKLGCIIDDNEFITITGGNIK